MSRPVLVAVPKQPLDPLEVGQQVCAHRLIVVGDTARILLQDCQTHGDMKPIKDMLGHRGDKFCQRADLLTPVSQEGDVLIGLQSLALERVEQSAFRLWVVAMHQTDVAGVTIFWHRPADDASKVVFRSSQLRT